MLHPWQVFSNHLCVYYPTECRILGADWPTAAHFLPRFARTDDAGSILGQCPEALGWGWGTAFAQKSSCGLGAIPIPKASQKGPWRFHLLANALCSLEEPMATHRGRRPRINGSTLGPPLSHFTQSLGPRP